MSMSAEEDRIEKEVKPSKTPDPANSNKPARKSAVTPMMAQFMEIKDNHQDYLLFYRMGDFYELFFDDAVKASAALDITLTKRGKHLDEDIPMCGVPIHAADAYLERLIRKGFKVAVCEQTEDPAEAKKRGSKAVVRREVVRLVTPGTLTEDTLLDARSHNYLLALGVTGGLESDAAEWAMAWADMSTGEFFTARVRKENLGAELSRITPGEILLPDRLLADEETSLALSGVKAALTPLPGLRFESGAGEARLKALYSVGALDAFGQFSKSELAAAGALVDYVELTQKGKLPAIRPLKQVSTESVMSIDMATRANLELIETLSGQKKGSLLATIDRTVTGGGARELFARLTSPLTDPSAVNHRLETVAWFLETHDTRARLIERLKSAPDIARALTRLSLGRGGPRDLAAIRDGLNEAIEIKHFMNISQGDLNPLTPELEGLVAALIDEGGQLIALKDELSLALSSDLPLLARDGGFVAAGYAPPLDELRTLRDESRRVIAGFEQKYRELTNVQSLKIKHNNVLGFFIDVSANHGDKLMSGELSETFIHRQTLANAIRFTTTELSDMATRIANASGQAVALELEIFEKLGDRVRAVANDIARTAEALAGLDVSSALAVLAESERYARPKIDDSEAFEVIGGRHPVVEAALRSQNEGPFVANDCKLSFSDDDPQARRLWLVTGPNMAGKSTFLRQNALIAIMAQMGSYVPAASAHIGTVDRLFSRVGAADDLARGRSTFMVEMVETAAILNQATPRSFVILDEIGRGTATFDGLSIAWAAVEHLHESNKCRALFATHYHELTALSTKLDHLANVTMKVKEWKGDVVFLHEVVSGSADRSYGIQVARLAGLPSAVIDRAHQVLEQLEADRDKKGGTAIIDDLPLFSAVMEKAQPLSRARGPGPAEELLGEINPDELTPREALDLVYRLKAKVRDDAK